MPVDMVYKSVSKSQQAIDCYLADSMRRPYHQQFPKGKEGESSTPLLNNATAVAKSLPRKSPLKAISRLVGPFLT